METDSNNPTPPLPLSPPPLTAPPRLTPPPAPKKSRGWKIFALILLGLLVISVLSNLGQLAERILGFGLKDERTAGPRLEEVVLEDNDSRNKIAVVSVEGIISSQSEDSDYDLVALIKDQLQQAEDDKHVRAVIMKVNSPGGEVLASDEIYNLIADFQETDKDHKGKPVIASMGSLAASGGYYISSPCRWIVANELTITGSIGVIMHGYNYRGLMDKIGVRPDVYKSGKFKDMLSPDRSPDEIPPEERAMVQGLIDETYQKFKSVVADGRKLAHEDNGKAGHALAADWQNYADGRVLSGTKALELGLVDELGDFDSAVTRAEKIAGLKEGDSNLIEYQPHRDLSDLLHMFSKTDARALKVDLGVNFPKLHAGYMYFIWPGYLR